MNTKLFKLTIILLLNATLLFAQKNKTLEVSSPNGSITVKVEPGTKLQWSVQHKGQQIIAPSAIAIQLQDGRVLGDNAKVVSSKTDKVNTSFTAINYKKATVQDQYNQLTVKFKDNFGVIFRVYDDGAAYRFVSTIKGDIIIKTEEANFNFTDDHKAFIPFMRDLRGNERYTSSFESLYTEIKISETLARKDTLAFLPLLVDVGNNKKALLLEVDVEDYAGMFIEGNPENSKSLRGTFAPYPLEEKPGGFNNFNLMATKRADYIVKTNGTRSYPWRAVVITENDRDLLNTDMVQKLASPPRIADASWVKPGKVAWDWWNDWNISKVDFRAGINTPTYKYYIDFASANKLEYIVMDEGWSEETDITKISPKINLKEIIDYGKQKNVDVILWATWIAINERADEVFAQYSKMGVKGFKIDFLDRNDQKMIVSSYEIAKKAANYKLFVDYHGVFEPTGVQRTYPNVVGFEGVKGLENNKWTPRDDVPRYDVTIPYIRMVAGPMDYTPGAMRNATKSNFRAVHSLPMGQGTRCHQLAMFVIFEAPVQMLADNPTAYMKEQESTDFIAKVPTVYDETVALDGKVAEYVAVARRKGDIWYVGAMTNWNQREITVDFSFLGEGNYEAEVFRDGINADRDATDYKREVIKISGKDKLKVQLMNGGGWAARIYKAN